MALAADELDRETAFHPDRFFLSPTQGSGIVRDLSGRVLRRVAISTDGRWDHNFGALHLDETFAYDDGEVETLHWAFAPDAQGRMAASEPSVTSAVRGWSDGPDYRLRFRRQGAPPLERFQVTYDVRFTLLEPEVALKVAQLRLFGVTLGVMTAFHRRTSRPLGAAGRG